MAWTCENTRDRYLSFWSILERCLSRDHLSYHPAAKGKISNPFDCLQSLAPLHQQIMSEGWGPLRLDLRPRWLDTDAALRWYQEVVRRLTLPDYVGEALSRTWLYRVPGLIHGDCHRRNLIASTIIDWESVALVDPYEKRTHRFGAPWPRPWRSVGAVPMIPVG